jgi:hypothetical protein
VFLLNFAIRNLLPGRCFRPAGKPVHKGHKRTMNFQHCTRLLAAAAVALIGFFAPDATSQSSHAREKLAAYSEPFAQRFGLAKPEVELAADGPLQAIEIGPGRFTYGTPSNPRILLCDVKLYVSSSIPIQLPLSGEMGSFELAGRRSHFFIADDVGAKKWQRLSIEDRRYFGRRESDFSQLAAIATPDVQPGTRGSLMTLHYRSFVRDVFPGLHFVEIGIPCRWIEQYESRYPAAEIWLKRIGGKDYREITSPFMDPDDFVKLPIPAELMRRAKPLLDAAKSTK